MGFNVIKCLSGNGVQLWFSFPKMKLMTLTGKEIENKVKLFTNNIKVKYETKRLNRSNWRLGAVVSMGTLSMKQYNRKTWISKTSNNFWKKRHKILENY